MRGKFSEISMPGTLVLMGLYGPRISMGAFGFMSRVSSCDRPPPRNSMMQFMSFFGSTAPSAFIAKRSLSPRPSMESAPACRKSRRRRPSQHPTGLSESKRHTQARLTGVWCHFIALSQQVEVYFDGCGRCDRSAVLISGPEFPLFYRLHCLLVEPQPEPLHHAHIG